MAATLVPIFAYRARTKKNKLRTVADNAIAELTPEFAHPGRVLLATTLPTPYTFWIFPSQDAAVARIAACGAADRVWFHCVDDDIPTYAYMDCDCTASARYASAAEWHAAVRRIVALFCCFCDAYYVRPTAPAFYDGQWRLYDASGADKWSAHAHARLCFATVAEQAALATAFAAWLRAAHIARDPLVAPLFYVRGASHGPAHDQCIFDATVYNRRPFRLPHNAKAYGRPVLRPFPDAPPRSVADDIDFGFVHPRPDVQPRLLPTLESLMRVRTAIAAFCFTHPPPGDTGRAAYARVASAALGHDVSDDPGPAADDLAPAAPRRVAVATAWGVLLERGVAPAAALAEAVAGGVAALHGITWAHAAPPDARTWTEFALLVLRAHAYVAHEPALDVFLRGETLLPADVAPAAVAAWHALAPAVLPTPRCAITLDRQHLGAASPFGQRPASPWKT